MAANTRQERHPLPILSLLLVFSTLVSSATTPSQPPSPSPSSSPSPSKPTPKPAPRSSAALDPRQLTALQSLNVPTGKDPCKSPAVVCDESSPFRRVISLQLTNCSDDVALSATALRSLTSLTTLRFLNCPVTAVHLPAELAVNLRTFSAVRSLKRLTGVWLSRLTELTDLTVTDVAVKASGPFVILGNMKRISSITVARANLTGNIPRHLSPNLTLIDFSGNQLRGRIPGSVNRLENLLTLNLSRNMISGEIPTAVGDLIALKELSLASNTLTGPIPDEISAIPGIEHVDLSSNQLNGTIPRFFSTMKSLKHLNLANNNLRGVMPFNASFISRLTVFRVAGNDQLCYNRSVLSSKLKLGIAQCDRHGLPMSPPPGKDTSEDDTGDSDYDEDDDGKVDQASHKDTHHGPNKVVLGVAIGLSSIVFLIIFLILLSKCCR